jgi:hypothetical protein
MAMTCGARGERGGERARRVSGAVQREARRRRAAARGAAHAAAVGSVRGAREVPRAAAARRGRARRRSARRDGVVAWRSAGARGARTRRGVSTGRHAGSSCCVKRESGGAGGGGGAGTARQPMRLGNPSAHERAPRRCASPGCCRRRQRAQCRRAAAHLGSRLAAAASCLCGRSGIAASARVPSPAGAPPRRAASAADALRRAGGSPRRACGAARLGAGVRRPGGGRRRVVPD